MTTAPQQYVNVPGPSGGPNYPGLVYKDANGSYATVTNPWYLNASGILIPAPVDSNGNPLMALAGSKVIGPTLITTIYYTQFSVNSGIYPGFTNVLNRNATHRTFLFKNSMDITITTLNIYAADTSVSPSGLSNAGQSYTSSQSMPSNTSSVISDSKYPELLYSGDSVQFGLTIGATAPTTGNVEIYVVEVLGA